MRGGAIPLIVWGTINLILVAIDWVWEGTTGSPSFHVNLAITAYLLLAVFVPAIVYVLVHREAGRKGPPGHERGLHAMPRISLASAGLAVAAGLIAYGVVFGKFLVFIGLGLLIAAAGRLGRELVAQQRTLNRYRRRERGT
jgi:hypothetical protein